MRRRTLRALGIPAALLLAALCGRAWAVDGVVEINQAKALVGGVTPEDAAGFPVTISLPGSYRLTSNLLMPEQGATPQDTIAIQVTQPLSKVGTVAVAIDLNGFSILGNNSCAGASCTANGTGVGVSSSLANTRVANGTVRGMGSTGVQLGLLAEVERVAVVSNGGRGISAGNASRVAYCQARSNRQHGFDLSDTSIVRDSIADINGGSGIRVTGNGTVTGNVSNANGGDGITMGVGVTVAGTSVVSGNTANGNAGYGIFAIVAGSVLGNAMQANGAGIGVGPITGFGENLMFDNPPGCSYPGCSNVVTFGMTTRMLECNKSGSTTAGGLNVRCCPNPFPASGFTCTPVSGP